MDNDDIAARIGHLLEEERRLQGRADERQSEADHDRMRDLGVQLDQCWDLLRQRRARSEFGADPDDAQVRPAGVVEGYRQ
jgi:hypothetical protein